MIVSHCRGVPSTKGAVLNFESLFARIKDAVDSSAYLVPTGSVDPRQRESMTRISSLIGDASVSPEDIRSLIECAFEEKRIDAVNRLSALHVLAASPRVKDYAEAARLAGEQEMAALTMGGPRLEDNLASVDRHRGVLAFLTGHPTIALDHFTRALERQRSPENVGNVLATLLKLGELDEAETILKQVRRTLSSPMVQQLDRIIDQDPDLAVLRAPEQP